MKGKKTQFIFVAFGALVMLLFNVRYCQDVQSAERARFDGWVGSLSPRTVPEDLQIIYSGANGIKELKPHDEETRAQALRLVQVLKEAAVIGRVVSYGANRSVAVRLSPALEYTGSFSEEEARRSPQLQVFARLVEEFASEPSPLVASESNSR